MFEGGAEGVPAVEGPTRSAEPATRALEYTMSLRMRLLPPPPASSDVCAPGPFLCPYGSTTDADESPFHCLDCSGSQFFNIHRHHAVRDTTIDLINAVSSTHTSILSVHPKEPLVLPPADNTSVTYLCDATKPAATILPFRSAPGNLSLTFAPVVPSPGTPDRPKPTAASSPPPTGGTST